MLTLKLSLRSSPASVAGDECPNLIKRGNKSSSMKRTISSRTTLLLTLKLRILQQCAQITSIGSSSKLMPRWKSIRTLKRGSRLQMQSHKMVLSLGATSIDSLKLSRRHKQTLVSEISLRSMKSTYILMLSKRRLKMAKRKRMKSRWCQKIRIHWFQMNIWRLLMPPFLSTPCNSFWD